jgi:hypothetical protein
MGDGTNRVDLLTLEEFRGRLNSRLTDANALLAKLKGMAKPKLGTFVDANSAVSAYTTLHDRHIQRAARLVEAIQAAQRATDSIMRNYRTTEARNAAGQAEIRQALGEVTAKLGGSSHGQ